MCQECHDESDDDYKGESIEAKRRQAIRSVVSRHPELGIKPEEITIRYVPKGEDHGLRVNVDGKSPRYDIHVPRYTSVFMRDGPPLDKIALASWMASALKYEEVCDILAIEPADPRHDAYFLSEAPPLNFPDEHNAVREFETHIDNNR